MPVLRLENRNAVHYFVYNNNNCNRNTSTLTKTLCQIMSKKTSSLKKSLKVVI